VAEESAGAGKGECGFEVDVGRAWAAIGGEDTAGAVHNDDSGGRVVDGRGSAQGKGFGFSGSDFGLGAQRDLQNEEDPESFAHHGFSFGGDGGLLVTV
jgi:hypothetical protein